MISHEVRLLLSMDRSVVRDLTNKLDYNGVENYFQELFGSQTLGGLSISKRLV